MFFLCVDGKPACISYTHIYSGLVSPCWAASPFSSIPNFLFHGPQPGLTHTLLSHPLSPNSQVPILISQTPCNIHSFLPKEYSLWPLLPCPSVTPPHFKSWFLLPVHFPVSFVPARQSPLSLVPFPDFQVQLLSFSTLNQKAWSSETDKAGLDG